MSTETNKRELEIGALWQRKTSDGKTYYSGRLVINGETIEVVLFKNSYKEAGSKQPDWRVYKSQRAAQAPAAATPSPTPQRPPAAPRSPRAPSAPRQAATQSNGEAAAVAVAAADPTL